MTHALPWRRFFREVVTVALSLAVLSGALQVAISGVRHAAFHQFIWLSRDYVWMIPAANIVLFCAAVVPFLIVGLAGTRFRLVGGATVVLGTLGALSLLLLISGLHHLAALILALGVGMRLRGWVVASPQHALRVLSRGALWTGGALLLVAVSRDLGHRVATARRLDKLPEATPGAPNVLVVILDTVRAASMSFLGYARNTTPQLARLGAEGAVFEHAWSAAPWTLPSHAAIFTGRYPSQLSAGWRTPLDGAAPTLAEILAARGYRTAGFAANHFYTSYEGGVARGFAEWRDYRTTLRQLMLSATLTHTRLFRALVQGSGLRDRLGAAARFDLRMEPMWISDRWFGRDVTGAFLAWDGAQAAARRPYLAFLNLYDAHAPYAPPGHWRSRFGSGKNPVDVYDGAIAYMDDALGALFGELARRGTLDNTVVIVTADHGELFGEHGLVEHGNSLYAPELHVPLLVRFPSRVRAGTRISAPVTLRDLAATVLDAVGQDSAAALPGASWLALWERQGTGSLVLADVARGLNTDPALPVSRGDMQSVITDSLHYIRNGDGIEELYRWRSDAAEASDLVARGESEALLVSLRALAEAALRQSER